LKEFTRREKIESRIQDTMWKRKKIYKKNKAKLKGINLIIRKKNKAKLKGINLRIKHKDKCKT
jgi:hypothetical protein